MKPQKPNFKSCWNYDTDFTEYANRYLWRPMSNIELYLLSWTWGKGIKQSNSIRDCHVKGPHFPLTDPLPSSPPPPATPLWDTAHPYLQISRNHKSHHCCHPSMVVDDLTPKSATKVLVVFHPKNVWKWCKLLFVKGISLRSMLIINYIDKYTYSFNKYL